MSKRTRELVPVMTHPFGALDGVRLLLRRWPLLLALGVAGAVASVVYYLVAPKWYQAEILIVPKSSSPAAALASAGGLLGSLPIDLGGASGMLGGSDAERIAAILASRSVTDAIIERFDLNSRYGTGWIERTRKQLWTACETTVE